MIYDNHGRPITYLRLAVTDRCNLRCFYCMPEEGVKYLHKSKLLTYEEMIRTVSVLSELGISKVRITGGEPFVRHNMIDFMYQLSEINGIDELNITTNGILTGQYIRQMKEMGVRAVNLSLDTLDKKRFFEITRRDEFDKVYDTLFQLIDAGFEVKVNAVVMDGKNTEDILPLVGLTQNHNVSIRFIEEMPFNGEGNHYPKLAWNLHRILAEIKSQYPDLQKLVDSPNSTSYNYQVPDFQGNIGVIAAFSRTFCGTCNRIRLTATGDLKTCLYDEGVLNIRDLLRDGITNEDLKSTFLQAFKNRPKDGFEAERNRKSVITESMTTIGG
ncbi:GTP 3',8-cyclase MoaA [Arcicella aurantiaca]|uniref:GTP 3',8-cyclase MoaA n=1 Tax=Arcicella aurantiaca TaxID=591202 RepID=UPI000D6BF71F|nr:GTP 3',8-cyclase MoaA [Arcicella aurantiaca]